MSGFTMRLARLSLLAMTLLGGVGAAHAQSSDGGVVGTWRYAAFSMRYVAGGEPPNQAGGPYGAGASGYFTLDKTGHFIMAIIGDRPKFNAQNRREGNAEEFAAVVRSTELIYGTYTIVDEGHAMAIHIEKAAFPNWDNDNRKWTFEIAGDELRLMFPVTPSAAGPYVPSAVWKRVQ